MTTFVLENTSLKLSVKFYGVKVHIHGYKSLYVCAFYHPHEGDESIMNNFVSSVNRGVHAHGLYHGFVLEFKASLFFLNSHICHVFFEKSNLRIERNNTLNLECKEVGDQF